MIIGVIFCIGIFYLVVGCIILSYYEANSSKDVHFTIVVFWPLYILRSILEFLWDFTYWAIKFLGKGFWLAIKNLFDWRS